MKNIFFTSLLILLIALSCSLKEVTDKDLEIGTKNVKVLDDLSLIDKEEDEAVKKVMGLEDKDTKPESKENKILKNKVSSLEDEIGKINKDMNNLRLELVVRDGKILELKDSLNTIKQNYPVSGEAAKDVKRTTSSMSYGNRYRIALNEFNKRNYSKSMSIFRELLNEDIKNPLADNCQYWIGECYYGQKDYRKALIEFEKVLTFGQSNKDDDSQLKIGLCYVQLNELDKALEELNRLLINYPDSEYNRRAQRIITEISKK